MKTLFVLICLFASRTLIGQTVSDIVFKVHDKEAGDLVLEISEGDQFKLNISTDMTLFYTKKGHKEKVYSCSSKKNQLYYLSYNMGEERHEFNLVEGTSPSGRGTKENYSLLLEKVYESKDVKLYFSPMFTYEEYNPYSKYNSDTVSYITRNHYLAYGENTLSKHDGTVSSLAMRLSFAACNCTSDRKSRECKERIIDKFGTSRKGLTEDEMIAIIAFWEKHCMIEN